MSNADSMAHFDGLPVLIGLGLRELGLKEATKWVMKKLERDWKTITIPLAREITKPKYDAAKLLLNSFLKIV